MPIAEVLQTVHRYRVPGVVSALRDGIEKKIFIWNGDVIFASSGDREDSLGHYLLRMGRLTQQEFDRSVEVLLESSGKKRHGDVLVELGILTEEELYLLVKKQVKEIIFSTFDWDDGTVTFSVGQYKTDELIKLEMPTRQMIFEGVKSIEDAHVKRLVSIIGPSVTVFHPSFREEDLEDLELEKRERRYLELVDGVRTFRELIALGPGNSFFNARLIYAFFVLRLISKKEQSKAIKKIQWKTSGGDYTPET
ncbi:MAG: hypothetical protein DIJKHBIC_00588 [Thermoanaerobaculia bacterium]|nr:hypothetical protein [Thermoanaerobaculia bacterium]